MTELELKLVSIVKNCITDYYPYGTRQRKDFDKDCTECRCFHLLDNNTSSFGLCLNNISPRAGMVTICRQGCPYLETKK